MSQHLCVPRHTLHQGTAGGDKEVVKERTSLAGQYIGEGQL